MTSADWTLIGATFRFPLRTRQRRRAIWLLGVWWLGGPVPDQRRRKADGDRSVRRHAGSQNGNPYQIRAGTGRGLGAGVETIGGLAIVLGLRDQLVRACSMIRLSEMVAAFTAPTASGNPAHLRMLQTAPLEEV